MIVRILEEGQYEVPEGQRKALEKLDSVLADSVNAGDDQAFGAALHALVEEVRSAGTPLPLDRIAPSELVVPHEGASREEVESLISGEKEIAN